MSTQANYTLYYWPMPFRGCFVSFPFAYRNMPLNTQDDPQKIRAMITDAPEHQQIPQIGPPRLVEHDTGVTLSQMPAIVLHIAGKLGLAPACAADNAMQMKILVDCNDLLMEICRYNGSTMWQREDWKEFRTNRLPRWMWVFEQSLERGHLSAEHIYYGTIGVFALFGNLNRCLPELEPDLLHHAPGIHQLCEHIGKFESVAAKVARHEQRYGKIYCGGQIEQSIRQMLADDNYQHDKATNTTS